MNTSKTATFIVVTLSLLLSATANAQEPEELDESETERIAELYRNPIKINTATRSRLEECGLFSHYQVESIIDYRRRNGDILSEAELASLDGFNNQIVIALKGVLDYGSLVSAGRSSTKLKCRTTTYAGGSLKITDDDQCAPGYFTKIQFALGDRLNINAGVRNGDWSASGTWYGSGHLEKIVIGDFNARFGQGLTLWSGFSLSGLNSSSAFSKRATGLSGASAYNGSYYIRGGGMQFHFGDFTISGFGSLNALFGGNVSFNRRKFDIGLSGCWSNDYSRIGMDFRYSAKGWDFWGEGVYDFTSKSFAGVGGCRWNIDYRKSIVLLMRHYPTGLPSVFSGAARASSKASGETAVALGASFGELSSTLDAAAIYGKYLQFKSVSVWPFHLGEYLNVRVRAGFRVRPETELPFKADIRADALFSRWHWRANARAEYIRCSGNAFLIYGESGYVQDKLSLWLRSSVFHIDSWEDRIYVYERDVPGTFSSPAYYGRGVSSDFYLSWKLSCHSTIYGRIMGIYHINGNSWKLSCRIQYVFKI